MTPSIAGLDVLTEVGRGGFGTVFAATDHRFARKVAVKVIRDAGVGRDVVARFERECLALGSLSGHPNIVSVYDQGVAEEGDLYLVMEFLSGGSFAHRLASRGRVGSAEVAVWGGALAGALETAHRSGIVHRDVKPENILFSGYGVPKLVDFGIARMRSAYETRTGFVSATLNHAAPEIVAGSSVSPSADVYSLASVLFTMLAGDAPFDREGEDSLAPLIARIATAPPPDLRGLGVPPELCDVIERGLAKRPDERFGSAAAFGSALSECAREIGLPAVEVPLGDAEQVAEAAATIAVGPPTPNDAGLTTDVPRDRVVLPRPETAPEPLRRRRWPIAVAAVLVLALGGGSAAALTFRGGDAAAEADGMSAESAEDAPALPTGVVSSGDGCRGFVCRFTVTSPIPLPDGAQWLWSVDGVEQPTTGETLKRTFKKSGKRIISVVSSDGETTGPPATAVVRLGSWTPNVQMVASDSASTQGKVSITLTSPQNPECLTGTARLQVQSGRGFENRGGPLNIAKNRTIMLEVDRGETYQVVVARQDVLNGVCGRATSPPVYVAPLPVLPTLPDLEPAVPPEATDPPPDTAGGGDSGGGSNGGGASELPPKPNPGRTSL